MFLGTCKGKVTGGHWERERQDAQKSSREPFNKLTETREQLVLPVNRAGSGRCLGAGLGGRLAGAEIAVSADRKGLGRGRRRRVCARRCGVSCCRRLPPQTRNLEPEKPVT